MKLALQRKQQDIKGTFGGHKGVSFSLTARAILTEEEESLIHRYGMSGLIVHEWVVDKKNETTRRISISDLKSGTEITIKNLGELLEAEEQIKQGCHNLKTYLQMAATFGGEEIIDI